MSGDAAAAKERERVLGNRLARRKKWTTRKWKTSVKGNAYVKVEGYVITIFGTAGAYQINVKTPDGGNLYSSGSWKNLDEAKLLAFDACFPAEVKKADPVRHSRGS
jgi:hypothetical protein